VFGGRDGNQVYNDVWALDVNTLSWEQLAVGANPAPAARYSTEMIVDSAGENLYIATGQLQGGSVTNDVWQLNLGTQAWTDLSAGAGSPPAARYGNPGGNINDNLVVTHGFGSTRYDDTWQFNTSTQTWENITPGNTPPLKRCLFASTTTGDSLIIHGGCASGFGDCFLEDTWVLDTAGGGWRELVADVKPIGRQHQSLTALGNGTQAILFGGQDASQAARDDLWLLDVSDDSWQPLAPAGSGPAARYNHQGIYVPNLGLLIHGGRNDSGPLNDLWLLPTTNLQTGDAGDLVGEHDADLINEHADDTVSEHDANVNEVPASEPQPTEEAQELPTATPARELIDEHAGDTVSEHAGN
jgi:hypothetical protein